MSQQAETWVKHTVNYLGAVDEALADLFLQALERADYPRLSPAEAMENILADFLSGPSLRSESEPEATEAKDAG